MVTTNNISIATPAGLVSIIIPCCGMQDYTKLCVASVLRHSRAPFELERFACELRTTPAALCGR